MAALDGLLVGIVSLVIGALAIHIAAGFVLGGRREFGNALIAAAAGAVVYAVLGFIGGVPVLGPVLLLLLWIGVINWRYPGGWFNAAAIGVLAWLAALVILAVLGALDIVQFSAIGVPGV